MFIYALSKAIPDEMRVAITKKLRDLEAKVSIDSGSPARTGVMCECMSRAGA